MHPSPLALRPCKRQKSRKGRARKIASRGASAVTTTDPPNFEGTTARNVCGGHVGNVEAEHLVHGGIPVQSSRTPAIFQGAVHSSRGWLQPASFKVSSNPPVQREGTGASVAVHASSPHIHSHTLPDLLAETGTPRAS